MRLQELEGQLVSRIDLQSGRDGEGNPAPEARFAINGEEFAPCAATCGLDGDSGLAVPCCMLQHHLPGPCPTACCSPGTLLRLLGNHSGPDGTPPSQHACHAPPSPNPLAFMGSPFQSSTTCASSSPLTMDSPLAVCCAVLGSAGAASAPYLPISPSLGITRLAPPLLLLLLLPLAGTAAAGIRPEPLLAAAVPAAPAALPSGSAGSVRYTCHRGDPCTMYCCMRWPHALCSSAGMAAQKASSSARELKLTSSSNVDSGAPMLHGAVHEAARAPA